MAINPKFKAAWLSVEDYLPEELASETKHEYMDGQMCAMAGDNDDLTTFLEEERLASEGPA